MENEGGASPCHRKGVRISGSGGRVQVALWHDPPASTWVGIRQDEGTTRACRGCVPRWHSLCSCVLVQ